MPLKNPLIRRAYQNKYYFDRTAWIHSYKEDNPCVDCGQYYKYWIMQFDHTGSDKFRSVSKMKTYAINRIKEEIAKCDLVCANCHANRTYLRKPSPYSSTD